MAAYETGTALPMAEAIDRAREYFELQHGLEVHERLGARLRWRGPAGESVALRAFPVRGGTTRLEIDAIRADDLVVAFIRQLPQPGLLHDLRRRLRGTR